VSCGSAFDGNFHFSAWLEPLVMNWEEFNSTVIRHEYPEFVELDLRHFGARQSEAVDFWLDAALKQADTFGKRIILKTDSSVIASQSALVCLAKLQRQSISVSVLGE
jgi:hypothetical protein